MFDPHPAALPAPAYGGAIRALHWGAALAVIATWGLGMAMDAFPRGAARASAMGLHSTLGLLVLSLAVLRVVWRIASPAPAPEGPGWMVPVARLMHGALYAATLALPLSGLAARWARSGTATLVGGWSIPAPFQLPGGRMWGEAHEAIAVVLAVLVAAHVAAALFHHLVLRDGILRRMVPALSR